MSKNLVIVESPAKAKTIKKYLDPDFEVMASYGHVRDLVPKDGAVDIEHGFAMKYQLIDRNQKHVRAISTALKQADALYLATDPDREGEAIAWHLVEHLNEKGQLKDKPVKRVVFYEITKREVAKAINEPREVASDLVNAQQARRALDYLVGFNLSPVLWRKLRPGLSAGRVQSPALRLICERELEIRAFDPREYWSVEAAAEKGGQAFTAKLATYKGEKFEQFTITNEADAKAAHEALTAAAAGALKVGKVDKKQRRRNPAPPFTTSTLQQDANRKLGFTAKRTMQVAQQLYEGVDIGGETIGLITYMRTDSVSLAQDAVSEIREVIGKEYGGKALPDEPRVYKSKSKNAQEAHEAVRPSSAAHLPKRIAGSLTPDQAKLYELIWKRTVASQMNPAVYDTVTARLEAGDEHAFRASGSVLVEPGFLAAYSISTDSAAGDDDKDKRLPPLDEGDTVQLNDVLTGQHFTEPPPRYTEASLVKTLEEFDIGRPSTYASIISVLVARQYVEMQGKAFVPTDIGMLVNKFLTEHFTRYVDYEFTARLEDRLDAISRGEQAWVPLLEEFWTQFKPVVDDSLEVEHMAAASARELGTDPKTGKPVIARIGRFGPMVQIGSRDDEDKPQFQSLRPGQRIDTITLDEALELFKLPRALGETPEGDEMQVNIGRFGPYVRFGSQFASLKKDDDPYTISRERALELVEEKKEAIIKATLKTFEGSDIKVMKRRWAPFVVKGRDSARVPKDVEVDSLTLEACEALLAEAKPSKAKKKAAPKKKAAAKKPAAGKKAAPKKKAAAKKKAPAKKKAAAAKAPTGD